MQTKKTSSVPASPEEVGADGLNLKERLFVQALLDNGGLIKDAALKVGYPVEYAQNRGEDLLAKPRVQAALLARQKALQEFTVMNKEWVLQKLAKIILREEETKHLLSALDMVAKIAGCYTDEKNNTVNIQNNALEGVKVEILRK